MLFFTDSNVTFDMFALFLCNSIILNMAEGLMSVILSSHIFTSTNTSVRVKSLKNCQGTVRTIFQPKMKKKKKNRKLYFA